MNAFAHTASRGALRGASAGRRRASSWLSAVGASVWRALEEIGRRRAAVELRLLADRWQPFDPALADELRAAAHGRPVDLRTEP